MVLKLPEIMFMPYAGKALVTPLLGFFLLSLSLSLLSYHSPSLHIPSTHSIKLNFVRWARDAIGHHSTIHTYIPLMREKHIYGFFRITGLHKALLKTAVIL